MHLLEGIVTMAFGRKKEPTSDVEAAIASYDITYKGGLRELPKAKIGKIKLEVYADRFEFKPTIGSKFWQPLTVPYSTVTEVTVTDRTVSTAEGLLGGLDSRQLNQKNNIHFGFGDQLLRFEMLTGVTVMGQAKKCQEFEDLLRSHGIYGRFAGAAVPAAPAGSNSISDELTKLASLRDAGVLNDDEFAAAKARLLS
ncbi:MULTISPECIES: SHOCT domain-containing protein [unclassified Rhodococcus (in: high G+C Gram-positive bacteria)]|nr:MULTISPECIES: SHOCT domain-containing protein [unclassified Rhodococcus (in: high G+C Gram-positive bacteria)]